MSDSQNTTLGWVIFVAAIGMLFSMISIDLVAMHGSWDGIRSPEFVGTTIGHIGAVITAFIGGKLIPENRGNEKTRATDSPIIKGE